MRVISIESDKQRLGLSLKEVNAEEKQRWQESKVGAAAPASEADAIAEAIAEVETPVAAADDASQAAVDPVQLEAQAE
jgi:hypothetical protein